MIQDLTINCPNCDEEINLNFFDVLSLDEVKKEQLRKDELFSIECYKCHKKIKLNYDCLCLDEKNKYAIALCLDENDKDNVYDLFSETDNEYIKRIVNDSRRLLEKVYIFDCGLNDKVIEIMKCLDIVHIMKDYGTDKKIVDYFVCDNNHKYFYVLMDDESYHLEFDEQLYKQIAENIDLRNEENTKVIDYNWAVKKVSDLV